MLVPRLVHDSLLGRAGFGQKLSSNSICKTIPLPWVGRQMGDDEKGGRRGMEKWVGRTAAVGVCWRRVSLRCGLELSGAEWSEHLLPLRTKLQITDY